MSSETSKSSYFADADNAVEMARLTRQARLLTAAMGAFPQGGDGSALRAVLDVGCATGEWVLDVAGRVPGARVVGIDISGLMIRYARMYAQADALDNVEFLEMDVREPLGFPDGSFDLVHARLASSFLSPEIWPSILAEYRRVLMPGGQLCLTEYEAGYSTSLAQERLEAQINEALTRAKRIFSQSGRSSGTTPWLRRLLHQQGFGEIGCRAHVMDISRSAEGFEDWLEVFTLFYPTFRPMLLAYGSLSAEELDALFEQAREDRLQPDYCGLSYALSVWGTKPM